MLSAQAEEMIEQLTACQRRIILYLAAGFVSGFILGIFTVVLMVGAR